MMMRSVLGCLAIAASAAVAQPRALSPNDAPETAPSLARGLAPATYADALRQWRSVEAVNGWIGAHFRYDSARAVRLSPEQVQRLGRADIHAPHDFFAQPSGVCVDLARFGVETLRQVEPDARSAYLMIEFEPVQVAGHTLRRHWLALVQRDGAFYFFADSKRPGHLAGPYASVADFVAEYAGWRGRDVVAYRQLDSYQRRTRQGARASSS
jgi:hypothetical protein